MKKHFLHKFTELANFPRWRKVRIAQTIFSIFLLSLLVITPVYYSLPAPSKAKLIAVKLQITIRPVSENEIYVIVSAVDEVRNVDASRDDVVELYFGGSSLSKLEQSKVTLKNGQAYVEISVYHQQSSFLTARWVSGPTPLRETTILVSPLMWNY